MVLVKNAQIMRELKKMGRNVMEMIVVSYTKRKLMENAKNALYFHELKRVTENVSPMSAVICNSLCLMGLALNVQITCARKVN